MEHTTRLYETTFIINASIEDTQIEALIAHIQETITGNGGEIVAINRWGRKRLAYIIQKKNNGYFVNIEFNATGSLIARLEHVFLLDENILRFLTIQMDARALKARQQAPAAPQTEVKEPAPVAPVEREAVKEPLFNDDIEQKSN